MFNTLRIKTLLPLAMLVLFTVIITAPPVQLAMKLEPGGWTLSLIMVVAGFAMLVLQTRSLDGLNALRRRLRRATEGVAIGEPSQALDAELQDMWGASHILQQQLDRHRSMRQRQDRELERLSVAVEHMAKGLDAADKLNAKYDEAPFKELTEHLTSLNVQLGQTRTLIDQMKRGELQTVPLTQRHLEVKRLTESDLPIPRETTGLLEDLLEMQNALRRLTLQSHLIASDRLDSSLLDETIPGELGDAFTAMVETLRGLGERAAHIAQGDLSLDDAQEGSLHTSLSTMVNGLRSVVSRITQNAVRISTSAEEILAVLHEQELSASHQASGVEETQRTMETLLSSAKKIAESAQTVFKSAERTQANNRIISDRASELKTHSERIAEILESIKEIADRSDLLALNASLEGLRAGEAGKGFTLVANEMRRLAENVKGSVGDIKDLLGNIRQSALSNILAIEEGSRLSERTTDSALKITLITQQQQSGTEQVTQSMEELSHLINQGLAGTRQVTTAAGELAELSDDMRSLVDAFNLHNGTQPTLTPHKPNREWPTGQLHSITSRTISPRQSSTPTLRTSSTRLTASLPRQDAETTSKTTSEEDSKHPLEATQLAIHTQRPKGREELNATMRFVGYGDAIDARAKDVAPTLDVSTMSAELIASDYEDMDSLFHELDSSPSPSKPGMRIPSEASEASDDEQDQ